jgi:hypothetical protein
MATEPPPRVSHGTGPDSGSAFHSEASLHILGDRGVLLDPRTQRLYRLNELATLLWCCFEEGWSTGRTSALLQDRCGISAEQASCFIASALADWRGLGLIGCKGSGEPLESALSPPPESPLAAPSAPVPATPSSRAYRILDSVIELRGLAESLLAPLDDVLGQGSAGQAPAGRVVCTLASEGSGFTLYEEGEPIDACEAEEAIVPMLKAALVRMAVERTPGIALVHAAAVAARGRGFVMPAPAGSGKSTLAAALVLDGWQLLADDTTLLSSSCSAIRPVRTALCLKEGAWPVIAARAKSLEGLPVHRRADGHLVRYLPLPQRGAGEDDAALVPMSFVIFPRYGAGEPLELRPLDPDETFDRFLPEFYPLANRFDRQLLDELVAALRQAQAFELSYGDLDAAMSAVRGLAA